MNVEKAHKILDRMSYEECIKMWNDNAADHWCRAYEIHSMDDNEWWIYLIKELEGRYFAEDIRKSVHFDHKDNSFYYDVDDEQFKSFSTKEDMLFVCSEDSFIECIMNREE